MYFMNLISLERLQRNPTVNAEMKQKDFGSNVPVGFENYPLSQAADILAFNADIVPAGNDQAPMLELSSEVVVKFSNIYGYSFRIPEIMIGRVARLVGTDGSAKMSKSLGNVIYLSDSAEDVVKKVMGMYTDPNRKHAKDPGKVEGNPVFIYLDAFTKDAVKVKQLKKRYAAGMVGDVEVKQYLAELLNEFLEPIRKRRRYYEEQPELVKTILNNGTQQARATVAKTMQEVRSAMKLYRL